MVWEVRHVAKLSSVPKVEAVSIKVSAATKKIGTSTHREGGRITGLPIDTPGVGDVELLIVALEDLD
eukprot:NODE_10604_length_435_cov_5.243523_g9493_i0.p3 GENE.NODE_10604_length_435_cov_5.243523_g9493_i0~~NODE_10604_length_435_cov_5.243523_g9493_i0.p3  ORF type:complete len:67 (+),score=2.16 NODE_10604_length_435_cov_5.243523_g9493_i0:153-353(+)